MNGRKKKKEMLEMWDIRFVSLDEACDESSGSIRTLHSVTSRGHDSPLERLFTTWWKIFFFVRVAQREPLRLFLEGARELIKKNIRKQKKNNCGIFRSLHLHDRVPPHQVDIEDNSWTIWDLGTALKKKNPRERERERLFKSSLSLSPGALPK